MGNGPARREGSSRFWLLASGFWLLASGFWLLASGFWLLASGFWLLASVSCGHMTAYPDLHQHLKALADAGLLITIDRPINKDTEMHPLRGWQFRGGIEEGDSKAFLFTNVVDSKGRKYDIPVVVGALAASREIYRIGMGCPLDKLTETWNKAIANPIPPRVVENAVCQEIVIAGSELDKPGNALDGIPLPI